MRIFLDANVLFSACLRDRSRQYAFFALARAGHCRLITSAYALDETRRNLAQKATSRLMVLDVLTRLIELSAAPPGDAVSRMAQYGLPTKDAPILAAGFGLGFFKEVPVVDPRIPPVTVYMTEGLGRKGGAVDRDIAERGRESQGDWQVHPGLGHR